LLFTFFYNYLIHVPTGDLIRHAHIHASDHATPRSLVYRTKRALGVSHLQHKATFDGVGLTIHLHGSNVTVEAELIETL
jgi:hypothetical protein